MSEIAMMPVPGKSFQIAGVLALTGIVAAMLSGMRQPAPAPVTTAVAKPVFAERFDVANEPAVLKKADRLKIEEPVPVATSDAVPVKTESIVLARPDQPVEVKPVGKKTTKREVHHDVCTRHHMRKVATRGGRSWRCRR